MNLLPLIRRLGIVSVVILAALGLTGVFWFPLWTGGGFVGGDVYSYFLPQKAFYAERLQAGEFPLWNNRAGHGYPLVGESQTGPFYPFHLLFYSTLDLHAAYNASHLLHYVLAFVFASMYVRSIGLGRTAAALAGLVYAYGWFPPRNGLEWAIIGGAWLPLALWCVESFLRTAHWRYAVGLSLVLAVQMLAGHFNTAFITQVLLVVYIPARIWLVGGLETGELEPDRPPLRSKGPAFGVLLAALAAGFALAAVQLLPTWELARRSQRAEAGEHHRLAQGSIPPAYWSQAVMPWHWYSVHTDRDARLRELSPPGAPTNNQVEAHLYFGLAPLVLAVAGLVLCVRTTRRPTARESAAHRVEESQGRNADRSANGTAVLWAAIGVAALLYTPGWLIPLTQHLPGFGFFQGPGRFGIVTTLAVGVLAAIGYERLVASRSLSARLVPAVAFVAATLSTFTLTAETQLAAEEARVPNPLSIAGFTLTETAITVFAVIGTAAVLAALLLRSRAAGDSRTASGRRPAAARLRSCSETGTGSGRGAQVRDQSQVIQVPVPVLKQLLSRLLLTLPLFAVTIIDLCVVSRLVTYSPMRDDPPVRRLAESTLRGRIAQLQQQGPVRLFAPGGNLPTMLGCASTPPYFTFGPAEYVDPELTMPTDDIPDQLAWLRRAGVTHILSFEPLDADRWESQLLWSGPDAFLNPALNRARNEPLYLYELTGTRGRVALVSGGVVSGEWAGLRSQGAGVRGQESSIQSRRPAPRRNHSPLTTHHSPVTEYRANRVAIEAESAAGGRLVLTDLAYPGWSVTIDGEPAEPIEFERMFRAVDLPPGRHTVVWTYRPASLYWGALVSIVALVALTAIAYGRHRHARRRRG